MSSNILENKILNHAYNYISFQGAHLSQYIYIKMSFRHILYMRDRDNQIRCAQN